ncbi:hypothetical protein ACU5AX_02935 [Sphingomonas sp. XXL09]|uniref:hypothetical protein n=1 Tax=Sphingomonas sp. XXL09 TaxID=3457787 RepID=UPI00406BAA3C
MKVSQLENAIFLDIPGFLTDENTFTDDASIIRSLNRSAAVRRHARQPQDYPVARGLPSYSERPPLLDGKIDRSFSADLGNVRTLYVEAKVGDVVIMTPSNHFDHLLIGEITSSWDKEQTLYLSDYVGEPVPYRSVKWLSHNLTRRDFRNRVARRMQNRKAITRFDSDLYDDIFRLVYQRYVWGGISKIDVFAPGYSSADPTVTIESSFLIKYAVAAYAAIEKGEYDAFSALAIEEAADRYFDADLVIQIAQSFGSPGGYIAKLVGSAAAIVVGIFVGMALADESKSQSQIRDEAGQQIVKLQSDAPADAGVDWDAIHRSVTVGRVDDLRHKYGRAAKAKLGLTLEGHTPPQITALDPSRTGE